MTWSAQALELRLDMCKSYHAQHGHPPMPDRKGNTPDERFLGSWLERAGLPSCRAYYPPAAEWYAQVRAELKLEKQAKALRLQQKKADRAALRGRLQMGIGRVAVLSAFLEKEGRSPLQHSTSAEERAVYNTLAQILYRSDTDPEVRAHFRCYLNQKAPFYASFEEVMDFFEENWRVPSKKSTEPREHRLGVWLNNVTHRAGPHQEEVVEWFNARRCPSSQGNRPGNKGTRGKHFSPFGGVTP